MHEPMPPQRADTKQATPEQCPKCGGPKDVRWCINQDGLSVQHSLYRAECVPCDSDWHSIEQSAEYWKSRATTAELKVLTFHEEIVKLRSGPDRTTQERVNESSGKFPWICLKCGGFFANARVLVKHIQGPFDDIPNHCLTPAELDEFSHAMGDVSAALAGPDRTTRVSCKYDFSTKKDEELALEMAREISSGLISQLQAGPDRGQQDAPDDEDWKWWFALSAEERKRMVSVMRRLFGRIYEIAQRGAKSAREGQAPKGDGK